jgi:CHAT domain-containing protein/tetratricopeptide (TPR) repeat protein
MLIFLSRIMFFIFLSLISVSAATLEKAAMSELYEATTIESHIIDKYIPPDKHISDDNDKSKVLIEGIQFVYPIGEPLSSNTKAELILTSGGIAAMQLSLKNQATQIVTGTHTTQNDITQLHLVGRGRHGIKVTIDGLLYSNNEGVRRLNGIFAVSVQGAWHVEQIALNLNLTNKASEPLATAIDTARESIKLTQSIISKDKQLLSESEWIDGVPVQTSFDVNIKVKLDGVQLNPVKGQVFLSKEESTKPTIGVLLTTEGSVIPGWSMWTTNLGISKKPSKTEKSGFKVVTNNGHIQVNMTSPPQLELTTWHVKDLEHPDENTFVLVDEGTIDIQLDKEGKNISGCIHAKGKVQAGNRPESIFSAEFSGVRQGIDLTQNVTDYVGARPFDGQWNDKKTGKLLLHQQVNHVSGDFSGDTVIDSVVHGSIADFSLKSSNQAGESRQGFLSSEIDGLLIGMTWDKSKNFKHIAAVQVAHPLSEPDKKPNSSFAIKDDNQARELKNLGYDLASAGKHKEAAKILLQVVKHYQALEAEDLKMNLINQALPLNTLINSAFEAGEYKTLIEALKMALHVQNELQKSKADLRNFLEQSTGYVADITDSTNRMNKLRDGYDRGLVVLSTAGIGISFDESSKGTYLKISGVRPDMPASHAGVVAGDLLVAINGVSIAEMNTEQVSLALRGSVGSSVSIKLLKDGQYREVQLVRAPLIKMSSEQREALSKNMKAVRDFINKTGEDYNKEAHKLTELSENAKEPKLTDVSVAVDTLTSSIKKHQERIETQRDEAIKLAKPCFGNPLLLNLFQRFITLEGMARKSLVNNGIIDEGITANLSKLDLEEEALKTNPDISEMDKSLLSYSIITVSEFNLMQQNARARLRLVESSTSYKLSDEVQTANSLAELTKWLDNWRSRMVTDAAKIASLDLGQEFYVEYVKTLVEMDLPEQALQASEVARARAFADLLARPHASSSSTIGESNLPVSSLSSTKPITLDEIRQLVRDTGITVVEYFVLKDALLTWVITPPNSEFKDVQLYQINQQVINDEVQITQRVFNGKVTQHHKSITKSKVIRDSLKMLKKANRVKEGEYRVTKVAKLIELLAQKNTTDYEQQTANELKSLYDILIAPIGDFLPKNEPEKVVTIIPHDELFRVPFVALARSVNQVGKVEHYLVEDHTLTYAPSLTVLNLSRQMKRESVIPSSLLAVIKPSLGKDDLGKTLEDLPKTVDIRNATVNFYEPTSTLVLGDSEATKEKVLAEAPLRDIVLFYTHAILKEENSLESYIALTQKTPDGFLEPKTDGFLRAKTIGNQHLNSNLVILAACQTGRGEITGDGVQGLARMFMVAGAKNVMVSLWSVPQSQTLDLMYEFHNDWKQKKQNIASSLRQAQLELIKMYRNQVSLWAGFILIGEGK